MSNDTLLVLSGMGIPDYSARGLTQTLAPIQQSSSFRRTINGGLVNTAPIQFQKYRSEISCTDQREPAIDGIWPGQVLIVSCVARLSYAVGGSPARPVVFGSSFTENGFVFYRPILTMLVVGPDSPLVGSDEWKADVNWRLVLEEQ